LLRQALLSRMPLSWREPPALPKMKHVYDFIGIELQPPSLWQSAGALNPSQKKTPRQEVNFGVVSSPYLNIYLVSFTDFLS